MSKDLIEKLKNEIDEADWNLLKQHYERGALVLVDDELDIFEVAVAVVDDSVEQVSQWLDQDKLKKEFPELIEEWEKDPYKKVAKFIIIQPYVFIKLIRNIQ